MVLGEDGADHLWRRQSYGMRNTTLQTTPTVERILFTFGGIALYNMVELLVQIPMRFKTWKGLYFWSLVISTTGIAPYVLGLLFKFFGVIQGYPLVYLAITLIDIGWQMMVTGQSMVLYSRLHLICRNRKVQRAVLWMIIANWFISNIPTTVFVFGASSPNPEPYNVPYGIWERLQLCLYFTQEVIISGIYGVEVVKMLKPDFLAGKQDTNTSKRSASSTHSFGKRVRNSDVNKRILRHLLWVNVVIIALDTTLLVVQFSGLYEIQTLYKGFVYSAKLKMEFAILNQLTDIAQSRLRSSQAYFDGGSNGNSPSDNSGSSGTQWDPLATTVPSRRGSALHPSTLGVLPDIEKDANAEVEASGAIVTRNGRIIPFTGNDARKISTVAPLESCFAGRSSVEGRPRRRSAVRTVSFTEGCGPSTRGDDKLEAKWKAILKHGL